MTAAWIGRALIPLAVGGSLALMRKYLPAKTSGDKRRISAAEHDAFNHISWIVNVGMFFVFIAFSAISYKILAFTNQYFADADGIAQFQILPVKVIWGFFPGFGGICFCWEITLFLWSFLAGREKVHRYEMWSNEKNGFDGTKVMRWFGSLLVLPIGILTLLAVPVHSSVQDQGIADRSYATLKSTHLKYSDARRLIGVRGYRDRDGKFNPAAEILIDFADGHRWSSLISDPKPNFEPGLLEFLQQKTGLQVEYVEDKKDISALQAAH